MSLPRRGYGDSHFGFRKRPSLSGLMMLGLGMLLIMAPSALDQPVFAIGLIAAAVGLSVLIHLVKKV